MRPDVIPQASTEFFTPERCFITELLNTKDFNSLSIAKARVKAGVTTMLHKLNETDEIYYILSGRGEMEVAGENVGIVVANDVVFIPRNSPQRIKNVSDEDLIFLCICAPRFEVENYIANE
ncbi:cupin domain-containing protein [Chitinophagaceae bacterium 26-R-25]|nr:cupin domain-containing protein [Chitinophagaceae bacterium 26-R-25]